MSARHVLLVIAVALASGAVYGQDPEPLYGDIVYVVAQTLQKEHLTKRPLDDRLCEKWGIEFVSTLDPQKMYFLKSDVEEFRSWHDRLDELVCDRDLAFAEHVHERFLQRIDAVYEVIDETLSQEHDFQTDESFPMFFHGFAPDERQLAERWRLRIKFELLVERSSGASAKNTTEFLRSRYLQIRDQHRTLDPEYLCQIYADSLARVYDPASRYYSEDHMRRLYRHPRGHSTIGLRLVAVNGHYMVGLVEPHFRRYANPDEFLGWYLTAIRAADGTVHHLTEMLSPRLQWLIASPLGGLESEVTLELYNPVTHARTSKKWPRLLMRSGVQ